MSNSNKTKHTPGPWIKAREFSLDTAKIGQGIQQRVSVIESEPGFKIADVFDTAFVDMNAANAHLIAAAPEMLEALEIQVQVLQECAVGIVDSAPITSTYLMEQSQILKDIISKAKGGAS